MTEYNIQNESKRIFVEELLGDAALGLPSSFLAAAKKVTFVGDDTKPFIPTPCKATESSSSLNALVATAASAVAEDRYGIGFQDIEVNTDIASLFLASIVLPTVDGKPFVSHAKLLNEVTRGDLYATSKPIHQEATNIYKARDGRYYYLHGSLNAAPTMKMLGVEEQDVSREEAIKIYSDKVAGFDSDYLEKIANDKYKQAGIACLTPEEFFASKQGKIMGAEPLWTDRTLPAPKSSWPTLGAGIDADKSGLKPLAGIRVIDFSRIIAAPVISKLLAVLGAEVIKVTYKGLPDLVLLSVDLSTGKRDTDINLKSEEGKKQFTSLIEGADVLIDGYRPGVLSRLGFDAEQLRQINRKLVYVRENCYGFKGPLASRSGWQQISDCLVGISWLQGRFLDLDEPVVPLLPNSDYQTGLVGAAAIMKALLLRTKSDVTFDIDVSLTQFNIWYYRLGQYDDRQAKDILERNKDFHVRHYDEMQTLIIKTVGAMQNARPDLFKRPELFWKMSGAEWGIEEDIYILVPSFKLEKTLLEYVVPSGRRGRSKPEW